MDRSGDLHRTVSHTSSRHSPLPRRARSFLLVPHATLVAIEITRGGRGAGEGGERYREIAVGPRLLARDGFIRSLPFVSLFMKSREGGGREGGGREETGRTEIESPRDPCRPRGIN